MTGEGARLTSPSFTVTTDTADAFPISMQQKALAAGGIVTEHPEGAETTGKFVRIVGRITQMVGNPGAKVAIYVDDGCGLLDGRVGYDTEEEPADPDALGIRILVWDNGLLFTDPPGGLLVGDYVQIDGICGYESWTEGANSKTVRTIWGATERSNWTKIPEP